FLGGHRDDREASGILANLFWTPREDMEFRLRVLAERVRDGSQRLSALPSNLNPAALTTDIFKVNSNFAGETALERYQLSLHGRRDFDWGTLKSITSYQNWELDPSTVDLDLSSAGFAESTSTIMQEQTYITQELRFESPEDEGPLAWRAGVFFSDKDTEGDATRTFPFVPGSEQTLFDIEETNVAAYGRMTFDATDRLTFEAGGRVDYYDTDMWRSSSLAGMTRLSGDDTYFSPSSGVRYAVNDQVTVYATTGIGIKPAGFSAFSNNPLGASFDEEEAWANEIGVDVRGANDDWSFAVRGFWNEIDDYQLNRSVPGTTDFIVANADEVTSKGVEAEFRWRPIEQLVIQAAVGIQDTEFDSYREGMTSYNGNTVPFTPEFTASGGFRYDLPCGWFFGSTARLVGDTYYEAGNDSAFKQDDYVVVDAQFGYEREDLRVTLYGRNLLDEEYYSFINDQIQAGSPGDPQIFGVKVDLSF
ncbi:MAG: TonB-dependent receptor, partial [Akkermansiaceae bacterium]|nr:TonB-dependent receptor [Akkermansiaceae bacterium]